MPREDQRGYRGQARSGSGDAEDQGRQGILIWGFGVRLESAWVKERSLVFTDLAGSSIQRMIRYISHNSMSTGEQGPDAGARGGKAV